MPTLELDALAHRLTEVAVRALGPGADVQALEVLPGGVSSLTYGARIGSPAWSGEVVVKVAPPGLMPVHNRDVLRQARLLRHLAGRPELPVPRIVLEDRGAPPEVPPLFVMSRAPGQAYEPSLDVDAVPPAPDVVGERTRQALQALAWLHRQAPAAVGLEGETPIALEDELARWVELYTTVEDDLQLDQAHLAARLASAVPEPRPPVVVHGDYRLANMLFTGPRLEAVIDWEIWALGDPRIDLGWMLMHAAPAHAFVDQRPPADLRAAAGVLSRRQMLVAYREALGEHGASVDEVAAADADASWFVALGYYKTASTLSAIHKRDRRSDHPDPKLGVAMSRLPAILAAGHQALDA